MVQRSSKKREHDLAVTAFRVVEDATSVAKPEAPEGKKAGNSEESCREALEGLGLQFDISPTHKVVTISSS